MVTITAPKGKFIIHLEEIWDPQAFPTLDKAISNLMIFLRAAGVELNPIGVNIHDIEAVKPAVVFDEARTDRVSLMDAVGCQARPSRV